MNWSKHILFDYFKHKHYFSIIRTLQKQEAAPCSLILIRNHFLLHQAWEKPQWNYFKKIMFKVVKQVVFNSVRENASIWYICLNLFLKQLESSDKSRRSPVGHKLACCDLFLSCEEVTQSLQLTHTLLASTWNGQTPPEKSTDLSAGGDEALLYSLHK